MELSKNSLKDFIRYIAFNLQRKKVDEKAIEWTELNVSENDIVYFCLSSNPIISIRQPEGQYFFRECIELLPKKEYLLKRIEYFFKFIHNNDFIRMGFVQKVPVQTDFDDVTVETFKNYIYSLCSDIRFINNMLSMDVNLRRINYSIWTSQDGISLETVRKLGLTNLAEQHFEIAVYFIWQMRSAAYIRRNSGFVCGKKHSYFNAVRTISTQIVADKTGLSDLVVESKWCRLQIGNVKMYGVLSNAAQGVRACDCEISPTVELQRKLTELHLLDLICFQQDHGPDNYNIYCDENNVFVCAFDNDNANAFFPFGRVDVSLAECTPLIGCSGLINRKFFDYELSDKIIKTDIRELNNLLKPYLNILQRFALKTRINKIKNSIKSAQKDGILVLKDEWNFDYLDKELSGQCGITYLTKLFYNK